MIVNKLLWVQAQSRAALQWAGDLTHRTQAWHYGPDADNTYLVVTESFPQILSQLLSQLGADRLLHAQSPDQTHTLLEESKYLSVKRTVRKTLVKVTAPAV